LSPLFLRFQLAPDDLTALNMWGGGERLLLGFIISAGKGKPFSSFQIVSKDDPIASSKDVRIINLNHPITANMGRYGLSSRPGGLGYLYFHLLKVSL